MIANKHFGCALVAVLVWGLGGCREAETPTAETAGEALTAPEVAPAPEDALPAQEDPSGLIATSEMPSNFPEDVPQYPGGEVLLTRATGEDAVSLRFQTDDPVVDVAGYYTELLAAEGWSTQKRPSVRGAAVFANKGKRRAAVSVSKNTEGKTQVDVMIAKSPF